MGAAGTDPDGCKPVVCAKVVAGNDKPAMMVKSPTRVFRQATGAVAIMRRFSTEIAANSSHARHL